MANLWGTNPIILDTQNDDGSYDSDNDYQIAGTGAKYTTGRQRIQKIVVTGANTNAVILKHCSPTTLEGSDILNVTLETGALVQSFDFPKGFQADGLIPKTITSGAKVYIYTYTREQGK